MLKRQQSFNQIKLEKILNVFKDEQIKTKKKIKLPQPQSLDSFSKIFVIVTGGTIAMTKTEDGYACVQNGFLKTIKRFPNLYDQQFINFDQLEENQCITDSTLDNQRIFYEVLQYDQLIDSSNANIEFVLQLAQTVKDNYDKYDAFIILHGTDTMAYTASTLSFVLENLNKSVILTGSQIPMQELRSDAVDNFLGSLIVSASFNIPEVMIYFSNKLMRGNRTTKISTDQITAYDSHNFPNLGEMHTWIKINWNLIKGQQKYEKLSISTQLSQQIAIITITPFLDINQLKIQISQAKAAIIIGYGTGNVPVSNPQFMQCIKDCISEGKIIVIMSQCYNGSVSSIYQAGRKILQLGAILSFDMTKESTIAKLSYLIGKNYSIDKIKILMMTNLRGELTEKNDNYICDDQFDDIIRENLKDTINIENILENNDYSIDLVNQQIKIGNLSVIREIGNSGFNFDQADSQNIRGLYPIHVAAICQNTDIVEYLLNQNVNINQYDSDGSTALFYAYKRKNSSLIQLLQKKGANCLTKNMFELSNYINSLGQQNDLSMVKLLASLNFDFNISNINQRNIGHFAAINDHQDFLLYLASFTNFDFQLTDKQYKSTLDEIKDIELKRKLSNIVSESSEQLQRRESSQFSI